MHELTRSGYGQRLRSLFERAGRRDPERLAERLIARTLRRAGASSQHATLAALYIRSAQAVKRRGCVAPRFQGRGVTGLVCDASLGGLARWLRAAGFEAHYAQGTAGRLLVGDLDRTDLLLTSDVRVIERRRVQRGEVAVLWVPVQMSPQRQLSLILDDLGWVPRAPRCMRCGGALEHVQKRDVAERIPPRTARWLDTYFVCCGCDKLYWHGTHWARIRKGVAEAGRGLS